VVLTVVLDDDVRDPTGRTSSHIRGSRKPARRLEHDSFDAACKTLVDV
jgi:hypothetical protein